MQEKDSESRIAGVRLHLAGGRVSLAAGEGRREYRVRFIRAGRVRAQGNRPSKMVVPPEAVRAAVERGLFNGRASFVDHANFFEYPSLRNLVGVTLAAEWNEADQSADGVIRLYDNPAGEALASLLDSLLADLATGEPVPDVGLSLVFFPEWKPRDNHDQDLVLAAFRHVESVDFVFEPAADGRVKSALQALSALQQDHSVSLGGFEMEQLNTSQPNQDPPAPLNGGAAQAWTAAMAKAGARAMIAASGLPAASRERLAGQEWETPEAVEAAIEAERAYLAALAEDNVVQIGARAPRGGNVQVGLSSLEQLQVAVDALIQGVRPEGVAALSGIRELYHLLSGDFELHGRFQPERVTFANVNSSTMAGLVANALNKVVINEFQNYPRWWEPIVVIEDFTNLQQVKWITLGGVGELPTVDEGAAYTELTWDDNTETANFVKKGGYLGITIESIDKDDTGRLRAAPRALAQAAWLTLSKLVSAIFTANSGAGPNLADGSALFTVGRGNLGSTALSYNAWNATKIAMRKFTELNSGERLGALTTPKYLLVPPDLEGTALQTLATEQQPGQANYQENVFAEGSSHDERLRSARRRVITVDLWTDANDWVAVADPMLYPSIGLGFRHGRTPEIFSVASPTAGLMFTNDVLPVKARFFYAVGPTDWRGLYKHIVA